MDNPVLTCLEERRSVKKFSSRGVEEEKLAAILRAGTYAPTGGGRQSPIIVVVQHRADRDQLSRMNAKFAGVDFDPFYGAQTVAVVLADRRAPTCVEDGSAVITNLLNAAHAVGVDSCWIDRARQEFDSEEGKALLRKWGIEGDFVGIGHCVLGYRDCPYPVARARKENYVYRVRDEQH